MRLAAAVWDQIVEHARSEAPRECCGVLLAHPDAPDHATRVLRSENTEPDCPEHGYVLDPATHLEAVELEIADGAVIAAYYHSHPDGPARPSQTDRELAIPNTLYVIVGMAGGIEPAAWRLAAGEFVQEPMEII